MSWKFWEKKPDQTASPGVKAERLPKPKEIPYPAGKYLVVDLGQDPEWVWKLKGAVRKRPEGKNAYDVRVFSESDTSTRKMIVKDYNFLDAYPELILYEGWFDNKTNEAHLKAK